MNLSNERHIFEYFAYVIIIYNNKIYASYSIHDRLALRMVFVSECFQRFEWMIVNRIKTKRTSSIPMQTTTAAEYQTVTRRVFFLFFVCIYWLSLQLYTNISMIISYTPARCTTTNRYTMYSRWTQSSVVPPFNLSLRLANASSRRRKDGNFALRQYIPWWS